MKEINFRYSNAYSAMFLWWFFTLIVFFPICLFSFLINFDTWVVEKFGLIGLIFCIVLPITIFIIVFRGSFFISLKLADKNGKAAFFDENFTLRFKEKSIKINYSEIIQLKCHYILPYRLYKFKPNGFKFKIKMQNKIHYFRSSPKEEYENRNEKGREYKTTLENVYDEIFASLTIYLGQKGELD